MTTINLLQKQQGEGRSVARSSNGGFIFSVSILVVVLLALGGLNVLGSTLKTRSQAIADKTRLENEGLVGQKAIENVVDMQARLSEINKNISEKVNMNKVLDNFGSLLVSGVSVDSYTYSDKQIKAAFTGSSFVDASRQLLNLKKSEFFTTSNFSNLSRTEAGVSFDVELGLK